jgi:ribosomal protein L11 methyltransferase
LRRIGRRFVIRPTWEAFEPEPEDLVIVLDPGQAFGTGDHQTTRLMLESMENAELEGKQVCDLGCGSGVLSIGAKLLGAAEVVAVDIDPISIAVSRENFDLNGVAIEALTGEGIAALDAGSGGGARRWDVVLSNIISATLISMTHEVAAHLAPGGLWIVSGIIAGNWTDVRAAAEREGLELVERREEDEWVAATFRLA